MLAQMAARLGLTRRADKMEMEWDDMVPPMPASKIPVTVDTAVTFSAVFRCVSLISGVLASCPIRIEKMSATGMSLDEDHPILWLLNATPDDVTTAMSFREVLTASALLQGTGYAEIIRQGAEVIRLEHIPSECVEWDGKWFIVRDAVRRQRKIDPFNMFVIANLSTNGVTGLSTVGLAREAIGLGLAAEKSGAKFFGESQVPPGVLTHPHTLSEEAERQMRRSWRKRMSNRHEIAILQEGTKFERIAIPAEDAQFLATRQFQVEDVARWFGLPPHLLGGSKGITAISAEAQGEEFKSFTLSRWVSLWEQQIRLKLLKIRERYSKTVRLDTRTFSRATAIERARIQSIQVQTGVRTRNECRLEDGYPTVDDPMADVILTPLNLNGGLNNEPRDPAAAGNVAGTKGDLEQGAGISSDN